MKRKTHVLEGGNGAGRLVFRCGRTIGAEQAQNFAYVGCAVLAERGSEVTCVSCIQFTRVRYGDKVASLLKAVKS